MLHYKLNFFNTVPYCTEFVFTILSACGNVQKILHFVFVQGFRSTLCYGTGFVVTLPRLWYSTRIRGIPTGTLVLCSIPVVLPTMSFSLFTTSTLWRAGGVSWNPSPSFFVMDFGDSFPQNRYFFQIKCLLINLFTFVPITYIYICRKHIKHTLKIYFIRCSFPKLPVKNNF